MFHCGEHLGEDQEACDIFVSRAFSGEEIVIEETEGGVRSTYTYTKQSGRIPRFRETARTRQDGRGQTRSEGVAVGAALVAPRLGMVHGLEAGLSLPTSLRHQQPLELL